MYNLRIYKDFQFPRYLQILPAESQSVMMPEKNSKGDVIGHKPGRLTTSGFIDIVTIPDNKVNVGDSLQLPWSVIKVESIEETRPARGDYFDKSAIWMRLKFSIIKSLVNA
jgi:hypothetical protein